eukprot:6188184-Pleurochrysis_carterae.AAC.8
MVATAVRLSSVVAKHTINFDAQAEDVIDILHKLARSGRTVVCTIHQPSYRIFATFDKLVMLARGRLCYAGSVEAAPAHFKVHRAIRRLGKGVAVCSCLIVSPGRLVARGLSFECVVRSR